MNPPLVSICIPTYNRPEYLRRAVESCLAQTYPHFEIIITDNSTNTDSANLAAKWTDARVHYHGNDGNIGPTESAKRALALAQGEHIKYVMDDDLIKPRCLELMVKAMVENPTAGVVMAPMDLIDKDDRRIFPKFYIFRTMRYRYRFQAGDELVGRRRILKEFLTHDYPCSVPSGIMYRREAMRRAGEFADQADVGFFGDLEYSMRLAVEWDFFYIDEVLSSWRYMPAGGDTARFHETGHNIDAFYKITRQCLARPRVQEMFRDDWDHIVRDSMFFCSCRALLNVAAGLRSRNPKLIVDTVKTVLREDSLFNFLRLPLFAFKEIWLSQFPPKVAPPRE